MDAPTDQLDITDLVYAAGDTATYSSGHLTIYNAGHTSIACPLSASWHSLHA